MKSYSVKFTEKQLLHVINALWSYGYDIDTEPNPAETEKVHLDVVKKLYEVLNG